jgi:malic enzyme
MSDMTFSTVKTDTAIGTMITPRSTEINEPMKLVTANALAELARDEVPVEMSGAYWTRTLSSEKTTSFPLPLTLDFITTCHQLLPEPL